MADSSFKDETQQSQLVELENRAKQLHREILSSLGHSPPQSFKHPFDFDVEDDFFKSHKLTGRDESILPELPLDEDIELIGLLNSKIGLDLLMLDESLSSGDRDDSGSSATVDIDLQKHGQQDSVPTLAAQVPPKPEVHDTISISNQYSGIF